MPIIPLILGIVIYVIVTVKKKQQLEQAKKAAHEAAQRSVRAAEHPDEAAADRQRRQEELKRRLQENQARRAAEAAAARPSSMPAAKPTERRPLEKRTMENALRKEKPIAAHTDDDCGGGSIHDGYHEGVTQFANRPAASVAGNLGHRLADEDDRIEREHIAAENAKKAMTRISKLPPLAQGIIYSEILGKPKSEIA